MKTGEKQKAINLRKKGYSLAEISKILYISKSSASVWTKTTILDERAVARLKRIVENGQKIGIEKIIKKRTKILKDINDVVNHLFATLNFTKNIKKIFCALLYWCEGEKRGNSVVFSNSDPSMIKTFITLLRNSFLIDEDKFRICLHLHPYHDVSRQKKFWSKITSVPIKKFSKVYIKKNGGKTPKKEYPGCVSLRYYDYKIAIELNNIWKMFSKNCGRVG